MENLIQNKYYLVTGGNSGIGKSLVELLLNNGANVYVVDLNIDFLESIKSKYSGRLNYIEFDLSDLKSICDIFKAATAGYQKFDGFVHCAGISPLMKIEENDIEKMLLTYKINVLSFIELIKYFYRDCYSNEGASIATMTSISTSVASFRQSVYSSSKAALEQVIKCAAKEFLSRKIRVNAVAAGAVETEMFAKLEKESEGIREKFTKYYPLGIIPSTEIAKSLYFLLSDDSCYIDGSIIRIDSAFFVNK